ncbi:Rieske 2Fe-2S domain-containing protein [Streptomyces sp. ID03-2B]|uniref:Rieske-type oxygenase n=1 Tax=Streptomyces caviscabies TaxID=90079 RepID=A0ABW2MBH6_9ACTN|nr:MULTISPECIES: Rieske 2Fe-2S domain-containing protein [unclassified Streptomyces]MCL6289152.1 3-ketosteroid-9-alpha-hydroxylase subunit A [Streptomyces sp. 43Y-GA-1]MDX3339028.1 Rieske 2Fe-2S domain-containing protein [Streptomyces sp. ME02-6979.5a]MDX3506395.1 Rieske 2Fe-2S domain-containing protein [Streptomyces sp. ATCC51928]MDX3589872.1 Rieske 2Fe-2S domain-containing protein [Streptomyces sp. ID03-2B]MDX5522242.1 Rieske 2Fe-2S domain-containing protein [Streptomyces sp. DE06-01C]
MTTAESNEVRVIETGAPPTRYARGWHCLGLADSFRDGKPHAVQAFGTKLVVFADSNGKLNVLNGYCPHMGGDLTMGTVKGDEVACPFHDWRWSGSGRCAAIPYSRRVPPRARTQAWTVLEESKQLFVWHDPQGNPPPPEAVVPRIDQAFSDEWSDWTWNSVLIEGANCREIVDNVVDMAHFFYVHYSFPVYFKNVFEGHLATQYMRSKSRPDVSFNSNYSSAEAEQERVGESEATYFGPSYMIDWLHGDSGPLQSESVLINCHYPVSPTSFVLQWGVIVKKAAGQSDEMAQQIAHATAKGVEAGFLQDVEIWRNKTRIDNPLLCEEDGPVYQLRRWYEQFYVDAEDVTPEMTNRFEFELDTERATGFWQKEVAENLERQGGIPITLS